MKSKFRNTVLVWVWRDTIIGKDGSNDKYFNADLAAFTAKKSHPPITPISCPLLETYTLNFNLKTACINKCENCRGLTELALELSKN